MTSMPLHRLTQMADCVAGLSPPIGPMRASIEAGFDEGFDNLTNRRSLS